MRWPFALALAAACLVASACGGSSTSPSGSTGTLRMMLTDSPFTEDAKSLLVTFSEVDVHRSDTAEGTWAKLPFAGGATSRTCDLKKLQQNAQDVLGTGSLATGHYTQIRLVVSTSVIYFDNAATEACASTIAAPDGRKANVTIPSGEVKLNREFDVSSATTTTMLLDFDGDKSVRDTGNGQYMMSPVIAVVSVQ